MGAEDLKLFRLDCSQAEGKELRELQSGQLNILRGAAIVDFRMGRCSSLSLALQEIFANSSEMTQEVDMNIVSYGFSSLLYRLQEKWSSGSEIETSPFDPGQVSLSLNEGSADATLSLRFSNPDIKRLLTWMNAPNAGASAVNTSTTLAIFDGPRQQGSALARLAGVLAKANGDTFKWGEVQIFAVNKDGRLEPMITCKRQGSNCVFKNQ